MERVINSTCIVRPLNYPQGLLGQLGGVIVPRASHRHLGWVPCTMAVRLDELKIMLDAGKLSKLPQESESFARLSFEILSRHVCCNNWFSGSSEESMDAVFPPLFHCVNCYASFVCCTFVHYDVVHL